MELLILGQVQLERGWNGAPIDQGHTQGLATTRRQAPELERLFGQGNLGDTSESREGYLVFLFWHRCILRVVEVGQWVDVLVQYRLGTR